MTGRSHDDARQHCRGLDPSIADELRRSVGGPDLTRSIMGRVGYGRAVRAVVRRRRRERIVGRAMTTVAAAGALLAGVAVHQHGGEIRQPSGLTIPAALGHDLQQHMQRVNRAIQTIRERAPRLELPARDDPPAPPAALDEDVDRSAVGPVEWI